jgi:hypothetical protein
MNFLILVLVTVKKEAKMEYTLAANLLNTKTINDDTFNQTGYRSSQYLVQPRCCLFFEV